MFSNIVLRTLQLRKLLKSDVRGRLAVVKILYPPTLELFSCQLLQYIAADDWSDKLLKPERVMTPGTVRVTHRAATAKFGFI